MKVRLVSPAEEELGEAVRFYEERSGSHAPAEGTWILAGTVVTKPESAPPGIRLT